MPPFFQGLFKEDQRSARAMLNSQIDQLGAAALGNFILGGVILLTYYDPTSHPGILAVGLAIYALNGLRLAFRVIYRKYCRHIKSYYRCYLSAVAISFVNGLLWGGWGWLILTSVSPEQTIIIYVILAGITAGALATSSASRCGFVLFVMPTITPVIVFELTVWTKDSIALASSFSIYLILMISSSRRIYHTMLENVLSAQAKEKMVSDLEQKQRENERLNDNLQEKIRREKQHVYQLEQANQRSQALTTELYKKSSTDSLTGIANRRSLDEALTDCWRRAIRNRVPIALVMFDIDWFKLYNDSMGHVAGDKCLCRIASLANDFFQREEDIVSRYGGEEFAILLPGLSLTEAAPLAERFCTSIYQENIQHTAAPEFFRVTISGGVAALTPTLNQLPSMLIEHADSALYESKRRGRNTVSVYKEIQ